MPQLIWPVYVLLGLFVAVISFVAALCLRMWRFLPPPHLATPAEGYKLWTRLLTDRTLRTERTLFFLGFGSIVASGLFMIFVVYFVVPLAPPTT